jgi:hypothetical protein
VWTHSCGCASPACAWDESVVLCGVCCVVHMHARNKYFSLHPRCVIRVTLVAAGTCATGACTTQVWTLRFACCVLRVACCVLRVCCVFVACSLRVRCVCVACACCVAFFAFLRAACFACFVYYVCGVGCTYLQMSDIIWCFSVLWCSIVYIYVEIVIQSARVCHHLLLKR